MRLKNPLLKYWAVFETQLVQSLAYPVDLASRSLSIVLFMFIFAQLWKATYSSAGQSSIAGLSISETLWYLMLAETIILSRPRLSTAVANAVKDGSIAYLLNKPYNFLLYQFSVGMGDSLVRMGMNALAGGAVVWLLVGPPPDPRGWPLVLVAVLGAWLIDFCLSSMIGLAAFVTEDIAAFEWIYSKVQFILGGLLLPLDFYPGFIRAAAERLPFAYMVYAPARLFVDPSLERFGALITGQSLWLGVLGLALVWLYQRGLRWLAINGG